MLLVTEALLLVLAALGQDHRAAVAGEKIFPLDMALDSVDDQYFSCRMNMTQEVNNNYLKKELKNSDEFKNAWEESKKNVSRNWPWPKYKLTRNHKIAIYIYSHPIFNIFSKLNNDIRNGKQKYTDKKYKWYSLQFLLTDAIRILKKTQNRCFKTYRGTPHTFDQKSPIIRFGSFASSSLYRGRAQTFGSKSCFEIQTCEGADVAKYSMLPYEREVLIPPYETFKVTAVRNRRDQTDLWCETVFELKSTGTRSDLNCALFNNPTKNNPTVENELLSVTLY